MRARYNFNPRQQLFKQKSFPFFLDTNQDFVHVGWGYGEATVIDKGEFSGKSLGKALKLKESGT
jgi:hypothetical protein